MVFAGEYCARSRTFKACQIGNVNILWLEAYFWFFVPSAELDVVMPKLCRETLQSRDVIPSDQNVKCRKVSELSLQRKELLS